MNTTLEQLNIWLTEPEGEVFEFKEAANNFHFDVLHEYCVAIANVGGGKIILGVTDKRPRRIVGTKAFAEPGRTEAGLFEKTKYRIPVEELHTSEGRILIVHVPSRILGTCWEYKGAFLKRAGDANVVMSAHEIASIIASDITTDFSAQICTDATLSDLSEVAIIDFRNRWAKKDNDERKLQWSIVDTLANAELLMNGKITYAALILFGKHISLGRLLPHAEIVFEYRASEAAGPASERHEFREGLFLYYDELWKKINLRNNRQSYQDGLFRFDILTFDEVSVREVLLNAVTHRDYRNTGSVFIKQYQDRLEVISPGGLLAGITPDNIIDQQNPRNRRLATVLGRCGLIERSGQGIDLMFERAIRQGKVLPNFQGTTTHQVKLVLEGTLKNPALVKFLERLAQEKNEKFSTFSTADFLLLDYIYCEVLPPEYLKVRIPQLTEAGVIEAIGRGRGTRYILSRSLYSALGERGVHTRKRGLDHETNKALIEQHLKICGNVGAGLREIRQVNPALSEDKIQRLLREMREEQRIILEGERRWARYFICTVL